RALLASDLVEAVPEYDGMYRLRDDVRAEALARLRAEHPSDELTLHTHVFDYFLRRLQQTHPAERLPADEVSCLYHLNELFLLIAPRQEWQILTAYVVAVRALESLQAPHLHQLSFFEGYVCIRTQNYDRGEAILMDLINEQNLEDNLNIQVRNALGQVYW